MDVSSRSGRSWREGSGLAGVFAKSVGILLKIRHAWKPMHAYFCVIWQLLKSRLIRRGTSPAANAGEDKIGHIYLSADIWEVAQLTRCNFSSRWRTASSRLSSASSRTRKSSAFCHSIFSYAQKSQTIVIERPPADIDEQEDTVKGPGRRRGEEDGGTAMAQKSLRGQRLQMLLRKGLTRLLRSAISLLAAMSASCRFPFCRCRSDLASN